VDQLVTEPRPNGVYLTGFNRGSPPLSTTIQGEMLSIAEDGNGTSRSQLRSNLLFTPMWGDERFQAKSFDRGYG
jgi:hypothetical protein